MAHPLSASAQRPSPQHPLTSHLLSMRWCISSQVKSLRCCMYHRYERTVVRPVKKNPMGSYTKVDENEGAEGLNVDGF